MVKKLNRRELNRIMKLAYKIWCNNCDKVYCDTDWSNVRKFTDMLEDALPMVSLEIGGGKYFNYLDYDGDDMAYRDYPIKMRTEFGDIDGYIRCNAAGKDRTDFSRYDVVISLWISDEQSVNESNGSFIDDDDIREMGEYVWNTPLVKKFRMAVHNSSTIQDVKRVIQKYGKLGLKIGTIMTVISLEVAISRSGYQQLAMEAIDATNNKIEKVDNTPQWDLLTTDVQATVYNAVPQQCNNDIAHTASMFELDLNNVADHKIIAMERTMMKEYGLKYGSLVKIEGTKGYDGVYQIQDTMNKRFSGQHKIDILVGNETKLGKWDNVKIYTLLNGNECADTLKNEMLSAKNQKSIDIRQGHLYNQKNV